jgi:O-antigen/teichoic acid export membrane protein
MSARLKREGHMISASSNGPPTSSARRLWHGNLVRNAFALMLSSGGTAVFGVVFWATAAHLATAENVGRASAEIAAMMLLANLAQLSFCTIFDRFLPQAGDRTQKFVTRAYAMCTVAALGAATIYICSGFGRNFIPNSLGSKILFVIAVALWTIFVLQDSVLTGLRATKWVPVENILFSMAKICLLPVFLAYTSRQGLFLAWTLPVIAAITGVNWYLFRKRIPRHQAANPSSENFPSTRELVSLAFGQYATSLISTFSASIVVLIVIQRLGAVAEAYYYLPALISSGGVGVLLWNLVTSFLVEASSSGPNELLKHMKDTIRTAAIVLVPTITIGVAFAPLILRIFGEAYAQHGTTLLRLLLLSLPGLAVTAFYSSMAWLDKRVWWLAGRELVGSAVYFAILLVLIGHFGILSIGIAAVATSGLQGVLFLPISIKRYRAVAQADALTVDSSKRPESDRYEASDPDDEANSFATVTNTTDSKWSPFAPFRRQSIDKLPHLANEEATVSSVPVNGGAQLIEKPAVGNSATRETRSGFDGNDVLDGICVVVAVVAAIAIALNEKGPVRVLAVVGFTGFVPGRAILSNWRYISTRWAVALSVLLSLTVLTLAATVTLWFHLWHPLGLSQVECALSAAILILAILRRRRASAASRATIEMPPSNE